MLPLLAAGLGSAIGGIAGAIGASSAAKTQARAADRATKTLAEYYKQAQAAQAPYAGAGEQGIQQLRTTDYTVPQQAYTGRYQAGAGPALDMSQFRVEQDPGYQFRQQEGQRAVEQGAAARGAGLSGPTQRALAKYGQSLASQEYGAGYDRALKTQQQQYGQWEGQQAFDYQKYLDDLRQQQLSQQQKYGQATQLANYGQTAAGNVSNLATGMGGDLASIIGQKGQAQAAGQMGVAQNIGDIFSGLGQSAALSYLGGAGAGGGGGATPASGYISAGTGPGVRVPYSPTISDAYNRYSAYSPY